MNSMASATTPHSAQAYAATYQQAINEATALAQALSDAQFNWKPEPGRWSVGECLEHLNTIARGYVPALEEALQALSKKGTPPFRYGFVGRMFIKFLTPESARKLKTPPVMDPSIGGASSSLEKTAVLDTFTAMNEKLVQLCENAEGLDLAAARISSPFQKIVYLQVGAFLEALAGHSLRHINQARAVTEAPGFPSA